MTPPAQSYREISLSKGQVALVDAADYADLMRFKWYALFCRTTGGYYAYRYATRGEILPGLSDTQKYVSMHRYLMGFPASHVDHRDQNSLHNWRDNLRLATRSQNQANRRLQSNNTSGYRGVSFRKEFSHVERPWRAYVYSKKRINIGVYKTAVEAAVAHDLKALEVYGEFAVVNFPSAGPK